MKDIEIFDFSIEEFDEMNDKHTFSDEYKRKKKELKREYRKSMSVSNNHIKVAVACAVAVVVCPVIANAATDGDLFNRLWGKGSRQNIKSHKEVLYSEDKNDSFIAEYPEREYEEVDVQKAEELIGDEITHPSIIKEIDGTTLTIISAVRDKNSAVVEFTLEKEGGVDALNYSQLDNESNGAWFTDESTFYFTIGDGGENIFVDLNKSTADKLYCYDSMTLESVKSSITMQIDEYPCTRGEYTAKAGKVEGKIKTSKIDIPLERNVDFVKYVNSVGGLIEISPLSIKIDMSKGFDYLDREQTYDPYNCYYVSINYRDGTNYLVWDREWEEPKTGKTHSCDVCIDNSNYACGNLAELTIIFNRLVDVDEISSITVNDVEYLCK